MSVYNAEHYLVDSIKSILNQSYSDLEFLIVDDCSSDNSYNIIKRFADKDPRIRHFKNNINKGLTKNLNFLISISKGTYIARMDADDISLGQRFEKQIDFLEKNISIDILGTSIQEINEKGELLFIRKYPNEPKIIRQYICKASPIAHPAVMMRKNVFNNLSYNEKLRTSQDIDLWFNALKNGYQISNLNEILLFYRRSETFYQRRAFRKGVQELFIYLNGILMLHGITWRIIFPVLRFLFRLLPAKASTFIYSSSIRKSFN